MHKWHSSEFSELREELNGVIKLEKRRKGRFSEEQKRGVFFVAPRCWRQSSSPEEYQHCEPKTTLCSFTRITYK